MKKWQQFVSGMLAGALIVVCILYIPVYNYRKTEAKINSLVGIFSNGFYKDLSDSDIQDMKDHLYQGLFTGIDPYTKYYTVKECQDEIDSQDMEFCGIGIISKYSEKLHNFVIVKVYENSPAEREGLKKGDIIKSVDGLESDVADLFTFTGGIKGEEGTQVKLGIQRDNKDLLFNITRENLFFPTVEYQIIDNVGYIKISSFSENTGDELDKVLIELENKNISKIILDLRNNPGGMSESVLNVCSKLFPSDVLYYDVYKDDTKEEHTFNSSLVKNRFDNIYVLTNHLTASCSEILASYIQENDYGKVIGEQTFGKGCTQDFIRFNDGTGLKYTKSLWKTKKGRCFQNRGIIPDYYCKDEKENYDNYEIDRNNDKILDFILDLSRDS